MDGSCSTGRELRGDARVGITCARGNRRKQVARVALARVAGVVRPHGTRRLVEVTPDVAALRGCVVGATVREAHRGMCLDRVAGLNLLGRFGVAIVARQRLADAGGQSRVEVGHVRAHASRVDGSVEPSSESGGVRVIARSHDTPCTTSRSPRRCRRHVRRSGRIGVARNSHRTAVDDATRDPTGHDPPAARRGSRCNQSPRRCSTSATCRSTMLRHGSTRWSTAASRRPIREPLGGGVGPGVVDREASEVDDRSTRPRWRCAWTLARSFPRAAGDRCRRSRPGAPSGRRRRRARSALAAVACRARDRRLLVAAGLRAADADRPARVVLPVTLLAGRQRKSVLRQVLAVKRGAARIGPACRMDASLGSGSPLLGTADDRDERQADAKVAALRTADPQSNRRSVVSPVRVRFVMRVCAEPRSPPASYAPRRKLCVDANNSPARHDGPTRNHVRSPAPSQSGPRAC